MFYCKHGNTPSPMQIQHFFHFSLEENQATVTIRTTSMKLTGTDRQMDGWTDGCKDSGTDGQDHVLSQAGALTKN